MRTLHINDQVTWRGGEQQTLYLLEGLARRGIETILVAQPDSEIAARARRAAIPVHSLRMRGELDVAAAVALIGLLRRLRPHIMHYHTSHAHSIGAAASAAIPPARRPRTVLSRRVDFSIRRGVGVLQALKYGAVDRIVAISENIRTVLVRDGVAPRRIDVVHSGIDPVALEGIRPHDLRAEFGFPASTRVVLNAAALADHKGQIFLIDAAPAILARHPEVLIAIAGEGEERARLEKRIVELGVGERVRLLGFRRDAHALIKGADLFVMPSHLEGLGTVVLDALWMGVPVAASRAGGIPEMIEDGVNGLLFAPRDPAALAEAVGRVLDDRALAARLASAGPESVRRRFTADRMVEGNIAVYESLLSGKANRTAGSAR